MISFQVDDMTCGNCVSTITNALNGVDATAQVHFDLTARRVDIAPGEAGANELGDAIGEAGYTPVQIATPIGHTNANAGTERKGCCCG